MVLSLALLGPGAPAAGAATLTCPLGLVAGATQSPPGGEQFVICSGRVPSFDGTPLDVDLSLPSNGSVPLPLMVMLHGWGGDKTDWESSTLEGSGADTYHWNNAWFVSQGFAVLNYTARGFHRSCGIDQSTNYSYATDPACSQSGEASWTHLADRRWEIHDTQYLVGLLVDAGVASPQRIVATGGSYGGGQSWMLALSQNKVMNPGGSTTRWTSPNGVRIKLAAAIPKYPWADLVQALVDNGRGSDGYHGAPADGSHTDPIGVEKESYDDGLYALGQTTAQYSSTDPTADLPAWFAALSAGEPYEANPTVQTAIQQLEQFRSPLTMPLSKQNRVPVFAIQGLTDPLFPAIQAVELAKRLTAAGYQVWTTLADIGHSYADNPSDVWQTANDRANSWLQNILSGITPTDPRFTIATTRCVPGQSLVYYTATKFPSLASKVLSFSSAAPQSTNSATSPGPEAAGVDPITNAGCRTMAVQTDPGVASWTFSPSAASVLTGSPIVSLTAAMTGTNAELAVRLWDVDPVAGTQTLMSRAVYRILSTTPASTQKPTFELWPNAWQLQAGHRLKLELTQVDAPTWRPDSLSSSFTVSKVSLSLPVRS